MARSPKASSNVIDIGLAKRPPLIEFKDMKGKGADARPADTLPNALLAMEALELDCSYDVFRGNYTISGQALSVFEVGELSDPTCRALREIIRNEHGFNVGPVTMADAAKRACEKRSFHPVKQYLGPLKWDGVARVENFLRDYMQAPDTAFNRAVSRCVLVASVRRIYVPGSKFDYMTVLDSPEGFNKSTAIETLYGSENYSDHSILALDARQTEEALRGIWGLENGELEGMHLKNVQGKIKAQLSRKNDRTRRVWDRMTVNAPRTAISWGTTNDRDYLRAQSGENRRFFPVTVQRSIDIPKLVRDRDQIWAEAMVLDVMGESTVLPEHLWTDAKAERDKRTQHDPWADAIEQAIHDVRNGDEDGSVSVAAYDVVDFEERVTSAFLMTEVGIQIEKQDAGVARRVAGIMRELGWSGPQSVRVAGRNCKGYTRPIDPLND
jgi:predicted P-loop ATPase